MLYLKVLSPVLLISKLLINFKNLIVRKLIFMKEIVEYWIIKYAAFCSRCLYNNFLWLCLPLKVKVNANFGIEFEYKQLPSKLLYILNSKRVSTSIRKLSFYYESDIVENSTFYIIDPHVFSWHNFVGKSFFLPFFNSKIWHVNCVFKNTFFVKLFDNRPCNCGVSFLSQDLRFSTLMSTK